MRETASSIPRLSRSTLQARPIDLRDETPLIADEVDNEFSHRRLPAELGALASPISRGAPDERLSLHPVIALLAGGSLADDHRCAA
jgi:hypothetical protein